MPLKMDYKLSSVHTGLLLVYCLCESRVSMSLMACEVFRRASEMLASLSMCVMSPGILESSGGTLELV